MKSPDEICSELKVEKAEADKQAARRDWEARRNKSVERAWQEEANRLFQPYSERFRNMYFADSATAEVYRKRAEDEVSAELERLDVRRLAREKFERENPRP